MRCSTSSGGVGHSLGAVVNAYRDRVPLLIIAGLTTGEMLPVRPFLAADEPATFPRPYVKWSAQPTGPPTCRPRSPRRTGRR